MKWFGPDATDIRGQHMRDVLGEEAYEKMRPFVERALGGEHIDNEIEAPFKMGTRWAQIDFVPDHPPRGETRGIIALITDVTKIKTSEEALRRSEAALKMPRMNGIELAKKIKEQPLLAAIPIVFLTSSGNEQDRREAARLGARSYFEKPVNFADFGKLAAELDRILGAVR